MMRSGRGVLRLALAFGLAVAVAASSVAAWDAATDPLVIDPETFVELPEGRSSTRAPRRTGGPAEPGATGPRIRFLSPGHDPVSRAGGAVPVFRPGEPITMHARFLPAADGAEPDMETLRVRVRQGSRGRDITDMVKPYVEGTAIHVPVDFSGHAGEFRFEVNIMDRRGRTSGAEFRVAFRFDFKHSQSVR